MLSELLFDSGSWGQFLGGTERGNGTNTGFTDPSHVIGNVLRLNIDNEKGWPIRMLCFNK
jgi:hypothetical protein